MRKTWEIDEGRSASKLGFLIDEYILGPKSEQTRAVMKLHFFRGISYEAIAEEVDMSPTQVGRIVRKYEDTLLKMTQ